MNNNVLNIIIKRFDEIVQSTTIEDKETILYYNIKMLLSLFQDKMTFVDMFILLSKIIDKYYIYLYKDKIELYLFLIKFYFDDSSYDFKVSSTLIIISKEEEIVFEFYLNSGDVNYKQIFKFNINFRGV